MKSVTAVIPTRSEVDYTPTSFRLHADSFESLLSAAEAARLLNIHPVTLLRWAREGRVPHKRIGRRVLFRASDLNAWLPAGYTEDAVRAAQPKKGLSA